VNPDKILSIIEDMPPVLDAPPSLDFSGVTIRCKHCGGYKKYENKPFCSLKCKKAYKDKNK